jgi:hypothetical protein
VVSCRRDVRVARRFFRRALAISRATSSEVATDAAAVVAGHACMQNPRRGHYELGLEWPPALRIAAAFTEIAQGILISQPDLGSLRLDAITQLPSVAPNRGCTAARGRNHLADRSALFEGGVLSVSAPVIRLIEVDHN